MKIFLAGIIQGSIVEPKIHSQDWRGPIKAVIARRLPDAEVYCHYSSHPHSIEYDLPHLKATLEDGLHRAAECDLLIAYLPSASMGTALEMYEAYRSGAAVLTVSPMSANWIVRAYSDRAFADIDELDVFLGSAELAELLKGKAILRAAGLQSRRVKRR